MNELRWHPLYRQWVAVATERQDRPQLPADWCPFCPKWGRVPEGYDVLLYPNDFPAFALTGGTYEPHDPAGDLYQTTGALGACDVVLYHPDHNLRPSELSAEHWRKIIGLWTRRTQELAALPRIEYVYVFENTGVAIGVTMPHPHGQIYAFPFLPPLVATELDSAASHYAGQRECLYCNILGRELEGGQVHKMGKQLGRDLLFHPTSFSGPGRLYPPSGARSKARPLCSACEANCARCAIIPAHSIQWCGRRTCLLAS
ncbi:MAG: hypothetical protein ABSD56_04100 [Bryobacteraceae bacterium]